MTSCQKIEYDIKFVLITYGVNLKSLLCLTFIFCAKTLNSIDCDLQLCLIHIPTPLGGSLDFPWRKSATKVKWLGGTVSFNYLFVFQ
jgi:hypothetical protein